LLVVVLACMRECRRTISVMTWIGRWRGSANGPPGQAALSAHGRRLVVLDAGEVTDDLVRDMVEVLTGFCARLYGRRSARNRAIKAVGCAQRNIGSKLVGAAVQDGRYG
jgi:putative resolvase